MPLFPVAETVYILRDMIGGKNAEDDAADILSYVLGVSRNWIASHPEERIPHEKTARSLLAAQMRAKGAPIQYCVGKAAFRHLDLIVDRRALIPRPETEVLVDVVLARVKSGVVADIGTGTGAIALSLALEGAFDRVIATDISEDALSLAKENVAANVDRLKCPVELRLGSLLTPVAGEQLDMIVSNPPYIAEGEMDSLPGEVRDWEPVTALASGPDGLAATMELISGAPAVLKRGGLLALEADSRRAERTADILKEDGRYEKIEIITDLTGRQRFVVARRR